MTADDRSFQSLRGIRKADLPNQEFGVPELIEVSYQSIKASALTAINHSLGVRTLLTGQQLAAFFSVCISRV